MDVYLILKNNDQGHIIIMCIISQVSRIMDESRACGGPREINLAYQDQDQFLMPHKSRRLAL